MDLPTSLHAEHSRKRVDTLAERANSPLEAPQELIPRQRTEAALPRRRRILLVDDHKVMRDGLKLLMEDQPGIAVVGEAADGREALELARRLSPDVIIMDISMPIMNGIEATRLIKAEMPGIRVIGLSMFEEELADSAMHCAGADDYIIKTASASELLEAIYRINPK